MARSLPGDVLPKGMQPPALEPKPEPLTLAELNYAGMIREALAALPFVVEVEDCNIRERGGAPPEILLRLTVHRPPAREGDA